VLTPSECGTKLSMALIRPLEFFSPLIFHHFPIEALPKKC
jgi:hypothetical protein